MTIYYLSSVDGSDASDGLSWDNAYATFKYAVETASAAASGPHLLYVDSAHSESLSAATTVAAAGEIRIFCINRSTGALATGAVVGTQATNYALYLTGVYKVYIYGMEFRNGSNTSDNRHIEIADSLYANWVLENCKFVIAGAAGSRLIWATNVIDTKRANYVVGINCTVKFGQAGAGILPGYRAEFYGLTIDATGTAPTSLFFSTSNSNLCHVEASDLSFVTGTLVANATDAKGIYTFTNCKLGSGVTIKAAAATRLDKAGMEVWAYNCDAGDNHYALYHGDAFGETTVSATIYANDGAAYDSTNKCSWKIVTTANCSYYTPYVSPWMDAYHSGTSAITPYLEALRSGSTTAYYDDEVWSEWSYQGTSGSTKATIVNDRMTPLGSRAAQTSSSLDASGWTGEDATNNWFGKLEAGSITPAEIGHLRARVVVGLASATVYVDPQIRATGVTSGINRVIPTGWLQQPAASGGGLLTHPGMGGGARG